MEYSPNTTKLVPLSAGSETAANDPSGEEASLRAAGPAGNSRCYSDDDTHVGQS